MIALSIGKITVRDLRGKVLGTVEQIGPGKHEYTLGTTTGYAASYADAVGMLRDLHKILPRTSKEQQRGKTRARTQQGTTSRGG